MTDIQDESSTDPLDPSDDASVEVTATDPTPPDPQPAASSQSNAALSIAIGWAILAVIVGLVFIFSTEDESYGGDAYTGIQQIGAQTVRAIGWLILATGPLGLINALSRR